MVLIKIARFKCFFLDQGSWFVCQCVLSGVLTSSGTFPFWRQPLARMALQVEKENSKEFRIRRKVQLVLVQPVQPFPSLPPGVR